MRVLQMKDISVWMCLPYEELFLERDKGLRMKARPGGDKRKGRTGDVRKDASFLMGAPREGEGCLVDST